MKFKSFVSVAGALMLLSPLASAGDPVQVWRCNINGYVSEEDVMEQAGKWKKAAGELAGGEGMSVYTMFPVSVGADGAGTDVLLAVSWESFSDFGKWWDAYPASDVAQMERETMTCHGSALWESDEI